MSDAEAVRFARREACRDVVADLLEENAWLGVELTHRVGWEQRAKEAEGQVARLRAFLRRLWPDGALCASPECPECSEIRDLLGEGG